MVRQGDVLVVPCSLINPTRIKKLTKVKREDGDVVLAHGEATGHRHRFRSKTTEMYEPWPANTPPSERILHARKLLKDLPELDATAIVVGLLDLKETDELVHEEHDTIPHKPGQYLVLRQREYAPEAIRMVAD